jgi:xanthine dehydrogenase YagR molybdenum-binding subunit
MNTTNYVGKPISRVDGRAKVTGEAKYAGEFNVPNLTYGVVVSSAIARGKITKIDASAALALDGVLQVFSHENIPSLAWLNRSYKDDDAPKGKHFRPLQKPEIQFSQQPIALVVAESFEVARYAASLVRVEYKVDKHVTDLEQKRTDNHEAPKGKTGFEQPKSRGNADKAFKNAEVKFEAEYAHPVEHHNPMELFVTTVDYQEDGKLIIYDKTQGVYNSQQYVKSVFGLSSEEARVVSPYVGGGFGSGLRPQYQLYLAVLAAQELKRSVRVTLTRQQMFSFGHRPNALQTVALGSATTGHLQAIKHKTLCETSQFEDYTEKIVNWSGMLYQCDDVKLEHWLAKLDFFTPLDMRAPGAATGLFALESAMDELAYRAGVDPLELRLLNYSEKDQEKNLPYSSKELRKCYHEGAEKFGWYKRNPQPRATRRGHTLIGSGMATGVWDSQQNKAAAKASLSADGKLIVGSGTADIGTGTYTIMTQIAAETLGLPLEQVTFKLGDTTLPEAPFEGGSQTAATVGTAVKNVCEAIGKKLLKLAQQMPDSPLDSLDSDEVAFTDGYLHPKGDYARKVAIVDVMRHGEVNVIEEESTGLPNLTKQMFYSRHVHSAVFAEVEVDEDYGTVRVTKVVSAIAGGRVLNPKTARSQILGAVVWGISMALHEESMVDQNLGRFMNHNLAEYHVSVNADVPDIDVIFVDEHDEIVNPLGAKGLGEIGILGVSAAIANAVFHATGKRVRDLPITLEKVM